MHLLYYLPRIFRQGSLFLETIRAVEEDEVSKKEKDGTVS